MKDRMSATGAVVNASLSEDGILLVLPVPFKKLADGRLLCEEQATNGIDQWAENFSHVTVAAPVLSEDLPQGSSTVLVARPGDTEASRQSHASAAAHGLHAVGIRDFVCANQADFARTHHTQPVSEFWNRRPGR